MLTPNNINSDGWLKDGTKIYFQLMTGSNPEYAKFKSKFKLDIDKVYEGELVDYRNYPLSEDRTSNEQILMWVKIGDITQEVLYPRDSISLEKFNPIQVVIAKNVSFSDNNEIQIIN